ncbi:MAG: hypothetical protein EA397_16925 [Deltaproteobacteria bacterium]|nr:MAG: hypothetical protein EA397_16925 [Deltaproteobacteria bacterium]
MLTHETDLSGLLALERKVRRTRAALGLLMATAALAGLAQCGNAGQSNDRITLRSTDGRSQVVLAATSQGPVIELERGDAVVRLTINDLTGPALSLASEDARVSTFVREGKPVLNLEAGGSGTLLGAGPERAFMQSCLTDRGCVQLTMSEQAAQVLVQHGEGTTELIQGASGGGLRVERDGSRSHVRVEKQGPDLRLEGPAGLTQVSAGALTMGGRERVTRIALDGDTGAIQVADPGGRRLRDLR